MGRKWKNLIFGEEHPLQERLFVLIILISALCLVVSLVADIFLGTTLRDLLVMLVLMFILGAIAAFSVRRKRTHTGAVVISALVIFVLIPFSFFVGGGLFGGPPIWFVFAGMFVSLILSGKTKYFFLAADLAVAGICYVVAYSGPAFLRENTVRVAYIDSYAALVFISLAVSEMMSFAIRLFQKESRRAEEQRKEIQALNDAQNRFFSSMSHEIRTPINTIIGLNEMILREDVSEEVAEDAANIRAASNMLLHLINDILDMSKLESGNMQLAPVDYRTADLLSELATMFSARAREKGLEFRMDVAPEVPAELIGDDVRIKQILINVLNNAVKYTREGSVTFSVQCGKREGNSVTLIYSVEDTGIGIRKDSIPFLFNAFKRVDEDRNRLIEGTGLGLSIVKQLVDLMGGAITVNSVYTQGSTFLIELPQQTVGEETVDLSAIGVRRSGRSTAYRARFEAPEARVLMVDDNASNLLVAGKLLRGTRVQVETASSGEEALRLTQEKVFHVIFMDHMMPEMDGGECHRRILAQTGGRCREAKVVALTANADAESRALYEREGFDGFLTKPIDGDALEKELQSQLPAELVRSYAPKDEDLLEESMAWIQTPRRKRLVAVTTESTADLPRELLERYGIEEIPHLVVTEHGLFRDVEDVETRGLLAYMEDPAHSVRTLAPDAEAHESFFAGQLSQANSIVHVALAPGVGNSGYPAAREAAAAFDNVTVLDSGHLSSGQGLQVLEACRLAEAGKSPAEIAARLEKTRDLVHTSFIVDNLDYLARAGQVRSGLARITRALTMRPVLAVRGGGLHLEKLCFGSRRRAWRKYIRSALGVLSEVDTAELFITYTGIAARDLRWIREQAEAHIRFDRVYFQKASPTVSVNCGPGTFGLAFRKRE